MTSGLVAQFVDCLGKRLDKAEEAKERLEAFKVPRASKFLAQVMDTFDRFDGSSFQHFRLRGLHEMRKQGWPPNWVRK